MKSICFLIFTIILLISCEKQNQKAVPPIVEYKEGIPVGSPYIKDIDEKGGQIEIDLNEAKIVFPQKLFSKSTTVSVQPIANTLSNFGLGIRISSEYRNVKVILRYPLNGLPPETFEIYYRFTGSTVFGWAKANNKLIDTLNHTISILQKPDLQQTNGYNPQQNSLKVATHSYDYVVGR